MFSGIKERLKRALGRREPTDPTAYWEHRARKYGRRAVLHLGHPESEFDAVTRQQEETLFPLLRAQLDGSERSVLDFGCGPGRFTGSLAAMVGGTAHGVDISAALIDAAPRTPQVTYQVIGSSADIRADFAFDVIWVCLVLGGIDRSALAAVAADLDARLRPGAVLFVVENVSHKRDGAHWKFRSADDYRALFPRVDLRLVGHYTDLGEDIAVLAGRKACATQES